MKLIKLLIIAVVLVGGIYGIMQILTPGDNGPEVEVDSAQAKMWKGKIEVLCKDDKWSVAGYDDIEGGMHTDRVTSEGELVSADEERALQSYLYALSCKYVGEGTDKFFKQDTYAEAKVKHYDDAVKYLQGKAAEQGANSNLNNAAALCSEYAKLKGLMSFGAGASYSHPLRAYSGGSGARQATIQSLPHYKSHFSNNSSIRNKVGTLDADMKRAEQDYYANLERCVEAHYNQTGDLVTLLEDQIRFKQISTNSAATNKLDKFVKHQ